MLEKLLDHVLGEDTSALDEPGEVPSAVVVHDDVDVVCVPREVLHFDDVRMLEALQEGDLCNDVVDLSLA